MNRKSTDSVERDGWRRRAFTMIEVVVVIFVIGVLTALVAAGVMKAREAARGMACEANLRQIGVALHSYTSVYGTFPPGQGPGSLFVGILPQLDQQPLFDLYNNGGRTTVRAMKLAVLQCPSDGAQPPLTLFGPTNYAGNQGSGFQAFGYNGAFAHKNPVAPSEFVDGMSQTAAVSEWLIGKWQVEPPTPPRTTYQTPVEWLAPSQLNLFASACRDLDLSKATVQRFMIGADWTHGEFGLSLYNHVLPIGSNTCTNGGMHQEGAWTAKSNHAGGAHVLFADGDTRFITDSIDPRVWSALGSRAGGEVVSGAY
jgi:prepilin-type N-terminal cleavage/methylation domain-containing protein